MLQEAGRSLTCVQAVEDLGRMFLESSEEMDSPSTFGSQTNIQTAGPPKMSEQLLGITLMCIRTRSMRRMFLVN